MLFAFQNLAATADISGHSRGVVLSGLQAKQGLAKWSQPGSFPSESEAPACRLITDSG